MLSFYGVVNSRATPPERICNKPHFRPPPQHEEKQSPAASTRVPSSHTVRGWVGEPMGFNTLIRLGLKLAVEPDFREGLPAALYLP